MKNIFHTTEWQRLLHLCKKWKTEGEAVVFTNGCFDGLHPGHLALLDFARKQGEHLLVGLNSDKSVHALKGEGRPVYSGEKRAEDIMQSGSADAVVFFDEPTPRNIISHIQPDILIKGSDYSMDTIVGADEVKAHGGKVLLFPRIAGYSSSEILAKHRKEKGNKKNDKVLSR